MHFEKIPCKPSVKLWNFTHDKRRKRQNKYTRLELKYYCWVAFNYAPRFNYYLEVNCLHSILWPNLASSRVTIVKTSWSYRLHNSNLKGLFCSKGWNILFAMEWMITKRLCHDSSFCEFRGRKHLPVSSIVFSSIGNQSFIPPHLWKRYFTNNSGWFRLLLIILFSWFRTLLIILFHSKPQNVFSRIKQS